MKAPQPVSLEGLSASRHVLVWLMLVFANGQGRPGACEERAVKGHPGLAGVEVVLVLSAWPRPSFYAWSLRLQVCPGAFGLLQGTVMGRRVGLGLRLADDVCGLV